MNLYFAPLEGITTYTYRNTHAALFGGCDGYYAPFITPSDNEKVSRKGLRDVLPERNDTLKLTVQVMANSAPAFLKFAHKIQAAGYEELNLNLGCPSATVTRKGRGAGFLLDPDGLDRFLEEIFKESPVRISVKTRAGYHSCGEIEQLMKIYNRYPMERLILHPRSRMEFYQGTPDMKAFEVAYQSSQNPLSYNGDLCLAQEIHRLSAQFPKIEGIMLGRGAIQNPALFREARGGKPLTTQELLSFCEALIDNYREVLQSEVYTLQKLKEIWTFMIRNYPDQPKIGKAIHKANKLSEYRSAVSCLPELS